MTAEDIKVILNYPGILYVLMVLGSLLSMGMQLRDARKNGATIPIAEYFLRLETVLAIGANTIAFLALIVTDSLNFVGAISIGYALNNLADSKSGGRTAAIVDSIPDSNTQVQKPVQQE
jgi:hypothetical protein